MQYLLMIYTDEAVDNAMSEQEMGAHIQRYMKLGSDLREAGAFVGSERLRPVADATTVRSRAGKVTVTDGPFAETKEQLGGYYLIDVPSLDDALKWAERIPGAELGSIEVRPIWVMEGAH